MKTLKRTALLGVLLAFAVSAAQADTLSTTTTQDGVVFELTLDVTSATTAIVTITVDTSGYTGVGDTFDAISFKVSSEVTGVTFFSSSAGGTWNHSFNTVTSAGCDAPGAGFVCSAAVNPPALNGGTFTFTWHITGSGFFGAGDEASIRALFRNEDAPPFGTLFSTEGTLTNGRVAEPASLLLFGWGLLGLVGMNRLRTRA